MKAVAFAFTSLALAAVAQATVLMPLDTQAMTARADRVVLGVVESQAAHWTSDHQTIYTDVTVRVARSYKGGLAEGARVVVRHEGGSLDGVGVRVFGAAQFVAGEEVLLFVETRGIASYTVGMTQGKLHVYLGDDGVKRVAADLGAVAFTPRAGQLAPQATHPASAQKRTLADVEREIQGYVRGQK
jgi:hypothetical protein